MIYCHKGMRAVATEDVSSVEAEEVVSAPAQDIFCVAREDALLLEHKALLALQQKFFDFDREHKQSARQQMTRKPVGKNTCSGE